ncbi:GNAT family N-acetyltransferase [Alteromonas gracilis]|uniref:GNAT family N-acetyltransferase n=1 Tax=Alteromonas gracilis TaxID=1479524 RepID=UPI00373679B2
MTAQQKITLSIASPSDKPLWDAYVLQHDEASAYHQFAWLEAVKEAYGHTMIGVLARCTDSGQVVGVFPAVLMKIPMLGKRICSLPYCDVGYGLADNDKVLSEMREFLAAQMRNVTGKKLEIRGVEQAPLDKAQFENKKVRMLLPLPESSETLLSSFKSKLRSQIRKAEKNGLTFELGTSNDLVGDFYDVYAQNMRDLGSPVHAKKWFRAIVKSYGPNSLVSIVYHEGKPIGGGIIIKSGDKASIPWASTLREFNRLAPNMLLYWSLLSHCADNGVSVFDFGRSTFEEGTYKFKKQWGAEPQLLNWQSFDCNNKPIEAKNDAASDTSKVRELAENIWRELPLKLTIVTGSILRPYISL